MTCLPEPVPWQRRQLSYWLIAVGNTLVPSLALMPVTFFCETRMIGAAGEPSTGWALCPLWQSTQVAWRLFFRSASSVASCGLLEVGNGCPTLPPSYSPSTFWVVGMSTVVGALW